MLVSATVISETPGGFLLKINDILLLSGKVHVHCCLNDLEAADYGEFVSKN